MGTDHDHIFAWFLCKGTKTNWYEYGISPSIQFKDSTTLVTNNESFLNAQTLPSGDIGSQELSHELLSKEEAHISTFAYSPKKSLLIIKTPENIIIKDVAQGDAIASIPINSKYSNAISFSPDEQHIFIANSDPGEIFVFHNSYDVDEHE